MEVSLQGVTLLDGEAMFAVGDLVGLGASLFYPTSARALARLRMASNIAVVSLPVLVFCRLTW